MRYQVTKIAHTINCAGALGLSCVQFFNCHIKGLRTPYLANVNPLLPELKKNIKIFFSDVILFRMGRKKNIYDFSQNL